MVFQWTRTPLMIKGLQWSSWSFSQVMPCLKLVEDALGIPDQHYFLSCRRQPIFFFFLAEFDLSLNSPMCLLLSPASMPLWHSTWIITKIQARVLMGKSWKLPNKKWCLVNVSFCQSSALQTYSTLPLDYSPPLVSTTTFQILRITR